MRAELLLADVELQLDYDTSASSARALGLLIAVGGRHFGSDTKPAASCAEQWSTRSTRVHDVRLVQRAAVWPSGLGWDWATGRPAETLWAEPSCHGQQCRQLIGNRQVTSDGSLNNASMHVLSTDQCNHDRNNAH